MIENRLELYDILGDLSNMISFICENNLSLNDGDFISDIYDQVTKLSTGIQDYKTTMINLACLASFFQEPRVWDIMSIISKKIYGDDHYFLRINYEVSKKYELFKKYYHNITICGDIGSIDVVCVDGFLTIESENNFKQYVKKKYEYDFSYPSGSIKQNIFN